MGKISKLLTHEPISQYLTNIINMVTSKLLHRTENSFPIGANNALNHVFLLISVIEIDGTQHLLLENETLCERRSDDQNIKTSHT